MLPGWLRLGLEQPGQIKGCGEPDCLPEGIDPVDNYCEKHGNFLPGPPGKGRMILLNACRVVVCLVFWAAAEYGSAGRAVSIAGANLLVLIAAGGWAVGLLSMLTGGSVRPGYATIGSTVILVFVTIWSRLRRREAASARTHAGSGADSPHSDG